MLGDNNDESLTYSVDDRDFLQVPGLPRIKENTDSQLAPESTGFEGDRAS